MLNNPQWYHTFTFPDGTTTEGVQNSPAVLKTLDALGLPADMTGLSVLDVGANDGFYSIECARRGASVTAIDFAPAHANFDYAVAQFGLALTCQRMSVYDVDSTAYDVILFLGVFYHLRYPLLALDILARACQQGGLLFVETERIDSGILNPDMSRGEEVPAAPPLVEIMPRSLNEVVLIPNASGLREFLRRAGFEPTGCADWEGGRLVMAGRRIDDARVTAQVAASLDGSTRLSTVRKGKR